MRLARFFQFTPQAVLGLAAVPIVGMVLTAVLFAGATRDTDWVQHSFLVKQKLSALESVVQDVLLGQRGYVLTREARYLEPYREAKTESVSLHRDLLNLVQDNADQSRRIAALRPVVDKIVKAAEDAVALVQNGRHDAAVRFIAEDRGELAMRLFRDEIREAWFEEDMLFEVRQKAYLQRWRWLVTSLALTLLASLGVAYLLHLKEADRRRDSEREVERLSEDQKVLEARVAERTVELARERDRAEALLRDTTHRIGNMLSLVVGFLNLHMRHSKNPHVAQVLNGARDRVMAISSAQRRMNIANDLEMVRIDTLIDGLVDDLTDAQPSEGVDLVVDIAPFHASARDVTTLCVLAQEFCMNALKHAFPDGRSGTIRITIEKMDEGGSRLIVADNGVGIDTNGDDDAGEDAGGGLGSQISERLAAQFGGSISYQNNGGTVAIATMPNMVLMPVTSGTPAKTDEADDADTGTVAKMA